ncbi:hypothetical protein H8959_012500 [Pygathrix nigripes]
MGPSPHAVPAPWHSGQASGAFAAGLSLGAAGEEDPAWRVQSLEKRRALSLRTLAKISEDFFLETTEKFQEAISSEALKKYPVDFDTAVLRATPPLLENWEMWILRNRAVHQLQAVLLALALGR